MSFKKEIKALLAHLICQAEKNNVKITYKTTAFSCPKTSIAIRTFLLSIPGIFGTTCSAPTATKTVTKIDENGVYVKDVQGREIYLPADTVIISVGTKPRVAEKFFPSCIALGKLCIIYLISCPQYNSTYTKFSFYSFSKQKENFFSSTN